MKDILGFLKHLGQKLKIALNRYFKLLLVLNRFIYFYKK